MRLTPVLSAATLAALAFPSPAGVVTTADGFDVETVFPGGPLVTQLADGRVLLGTGVFGDDALSVSLPGGLTQLFAEGFGSIAGVAQSPLDGTIVVGDSFGAVPLRVLADLNADGDALDPGENVPHPAMLPVLANGAAPLPFDLVFRPGTGELYMTGSTPFGISPLLGVVVRIEGAAASVWAEGFGFTGGATFVDETLLVADLDATFTGRVVALRDDNADGDALDAGEAVPFADALSGASDVVRAADGHVYVSGQTDPADFSGAVARLAPDADGDGMTDGVDALYFDGFAFAGNLTLFELGGPFVPGTAGGGRLHVGDFSVAGGDRAIRSTPFCDLTVDGSFSTSAPFDVAIEAAFGAQTVFVLALDTAPSTLTGLADVCFGFDAPFLIVSGGTVGGAGQTFTSVSLTGAGGAIGLPLAMQAFAIEAGRVGASPGIVAPIVP